NLAFYLETEQQLYSTPYLIDCWSLQQGTCILRNALNLTDIYYEQKFNSDKLEQPERFLFNTNPTIPNHIYPFRLKFESCTNDTVYLFLTSTLRKSILMTNEEMVNNSTNLFYLQCLEQSQQRTLALRVLVHDQKNELKQKWASTEIMVPIETSKTVTINQTVTSYINVVEQDNNDKKMTSSGPFMNINDYCHDTFSVIRSIYTDFFEQESSDKFRLFQDVIYDKNDSALYVFTNQYQKSKQSYVSKIIRLCEGMISFRHYVEITLNCGINYTLIQKVKMITLKNGKQYILTVVSTANNAHSIEPSQRSAICIYDLDMIRNAFVQNIIDLSKGNVSLGMSWLHGESVIPQYATPYANLARCSTTRDISYLMIYEGHQPISSQPLITFDSDHLTSIEAMVINNYVVAICGTSGGKVKKISIQILKKKAYQFEELFVHYGQPVLRHLALDEDGRFLYGATKTRLFVVDLHDCDRHKTCFSCLSIQNPYCGWVTIVNRCTVRTNDSSEERRFGWLQIKDSCPNIVQIDPAAISIARSKNLKLKVENIPEDRSALYSCSFVKNADEIFYSSNATVRDDMHIECISPPNQNILVHLETVLLRLMYNDFLLAETNVTSYDCSQYLSLAAQIVWITFMSTKTDPGNICPRYKTSLSDFYISNGETLHIGSQNVTVETSSLHPLQQYFQCVLKLTNDSTALAVSALLLNETYLICDSFKISYNENIGKQKYTFNIEWKECPECDYKVLEREGNFTVNVYKCRYMSDSCGSCILLEDYYNCIWCEKDKSCLNAKLSNCDQNQVVSAAIGTCPDPRILEIVPLYGPLNGQTPIKVYGTSLGKKMDDIRAILIYENRTEYSCIIKSDFYIISQAFLCSPIEQLPIGLYILKVIVKSVISKDRPIFRIVQPSISAVYPTLGPRSGGTILSINGKYLIVGNKIQIYVGTQECILLNEKNDKKYLFSDDTVSVEKLDIVDNEIIQCRTTKLSTLSHIDEVLYHERSKVSKRQTLWTGTISVFIDNFTETYTNLTYSYIEDPSIYNLSRYTSIESGGLPIFVYGKNLHSIQLPKIFLQYNNKSEEYSDNCTVNNSEVMLCYSPALNLSIFNLLSSSISSTTIQTTTSSIVTRFNSERMQRDIQCIEFKFGFIMDDVEKVRNTSTFLETFLLCPDPEIYPFSNNGIRIQYQYEY
ncbi:unnamed protein product, partial [Didymodactylos carnosus]